MLFVSFLGARELAPNALPLWRIRKRLSFFPSLPPPPSLRAMRDALRRAERPVMLRWIVLGALVTMGVIITSVVGTVVLARRFGVDFSMVDEGEMTGAIPLALLGLGVLLAFPASGYLVARASGADSVLEAALSTGLAIVGTLIMLGLAAPVAVVRTRLRSHRFRPGLCRSLGRHWRSPELMATLRGVDRDQRRFESKGSGSVATTSCSEWGS
jgi:hypothetical protein